MREIDRLVLPQDDHLRPWQDLSACNAEHSDLFFPARSERASVRVRRESRAKAICGTCPVMQQCRDHALRVEEPSGIWGGLTEDERSRLLSELNRVGSLAR